MKASKIKLEEKKIVGLSVRTNNKKEGDLSKAEIPKLISQYFNDNIATKILNKKNPCTTIFGYTNYESDIYGDYTYFVGEEVIDFYDIDDSNLGKFFIPKQDYLKVTQGPGKVPDICIEAWEDIWNMKKEDFGGDRTYITDFEIYNEDIQNPNNKIVDIYIGNRNYDIKNGDIELSSLLKALTKLDKFILNSNTEQEKAGIIQAFEYSFELSWKTMKKLLHEKSTIAHSPKDVIRNAGIEGFIDDAETWFKFLKKRNLTVHTYDECNADEVVAICPEFIIELKKFINNISISS